jgi:hypothetical protein
MVPGSLAHPSFEGSSISLNQNAYLIHLPTVVSAGFFLCTSRVATVEERREYAPLVMRLLIDRALA